MRLNPEADRLASTVSNLQAGASTRLHHSPAIVIVKLIDKHNLAC